MPDNLLPCPFCGCVRIGTDGDSAWCTDCEVGRSVAAWNRRPPAPSAGAVEALREAWARWQRSMHGPGEDSEPSLSALLDIVRTLAESPAEEGDLVRDKRIAELESGLRHEVEMVRAERAARASVHERLVTVSDEMDGPHPVTFDSDDVITRIEQAYHKLHRESENRIATLTRDLAEAKAAKSRWAERYTKTREKAAGLESDLADARAQVARLESERDEHRREYAERCKEAREATRDLGRAQAQVEAKSAVLANSEEALHLARTTLCAIGKLAPDEITSELCRKASNATIDRDQRIAALESRLAAMQTVVEKARVLGTYAWEARLDDSATSERVKEDACELSSALFEYDRIAALPAADADGTARDCGDCDGTGGDHRLPCLACGGTGRRTAIPPTPASDSAPRRKALPPLPTRDDLERLAEAVDEFGTVSCDEGQDEDGHYCHIDVTLGSFDLAIASDYREPAYRAAYAAIEAVRDCTVEAEREAAENDSGGASGAALGNDVVNGREGAAFKPDPGVQPPVAPAGGLMPWCPQCGPNPPGADEDGCCTECGCTIGEVPVPLTEADIDRMCEAQHGPVSPMVTRADVERLVEEGVRRALESLAVQMVADKSFNQGWGGACTLSGDLVRIIRAAATAGGTNDGRRCRNGSQRHLDRLDL